MTDQHRATPEQWAAVEEWATSGRSDAWYVVLELRARVEALEAMANTRSFKIDTSKWSEEQRQQLLGEISEPASLERFTDPRLGEPWLVQVEGIQHGPAMPPTPSPADSLVERVGKAILLSPFDLNEGDNNSARAAIREVAAWMRENDAIHNMGGDAAATSDLLDAEASQ